MHVAANFEVSAECSVVRDNTALRIRHPRGIYRARIKNIPRTTYTTPFLLSVHLYFDAPSLDDAKDTAEDHLVDLLNMLTFLTASRLRRRRIRQLVDASPGAPAMRPLRMWSDSIEYEDPHPLLDEESVTGLERLLSAELAKPIRRALRWYRLGVTATVPDDQFMNFWFALELIAEFKKAPDKVPDQCPTCRGPLYCETCKTHPLHRPYAKQAIRALLLAVDPGCDEGTVARLDKTRNSLMHGATLKEIEGSLPEPHEQIVDVLGRLIWRALVHEFPKDMFDGSIAMGVPSTYIHRIVHGVAHMETVVPIGEDGDLDLEFKGMTVTMVPSRAPQSARPSVIAMTREQHRRLGGLANAKGDHQAMCKRIYDRVRIDKNDSERIVALVLATDKFDIDKMVSGTTVGPVAEFFKELIRSGE